jgi:WD40 repeat protein
VSLDEETSEFSAKSTFDHPYPTTKIMWIPDSKGIYPDLLATSGDYLRVWRAGEPETKLECLLNNNKNSDFCAPLTSFDWNEVDPNLLGTSSIDTTCTVWGLETDQVSSSGFYVRWFSPVFRIRIRIRWAAGSALRMRIRIQKGENLPKKKTRIKCENYR